MVGFWRSAAARALAYREQRALAGRRGAGRPELDSLGYAPRSQRLAQLLGELHGRSRSHCVCLDCTAGCLVCYMPLASQRDGLLPKDFMPGQSRDLVESLKNSSRNVVERPV